MEETLRCGGRRNPSPHNFSRKSAFTNDRDYDILLEREI